MIDSIISLPFLIGYYDNDQELLLFDLSAITMQSLGIVESNREEFRKDHRDRTMLTILRFTQLQKIEAECEVNGKCSLPIRLKPSNQKQNLQFKAEVHLLEWGMQVILHPQKWKWDEIVGLPKKLVALTTWISDMKLAMKALVTTIFGLGVSIPAMFLYGISQNSVADFVKDSAVYQQFQDKESTVGSKDFYMKLLEERAVKFQGPSFNALTFFRYTETLEERYYIASYSDYLSEKVFLRIKIKNTSLDGWRNILAAHKNRQPIVIKLKALPTSHTFYDLMIEGNTKELHLYPVFKSEGKDEVLAGYIGVGFFKELTPKELSLVNREMIETAVLISLTL